jgi:hypothetical protein
MMKLFRNEANKIKITDKIVLTQNAKWENCLNARQQNKQTVFVAWFDETADTYKDYSVLHAGEQPEIYLARDMQFVYIQNNAPVIFLEHFPLHKKELALFEKLHLNEAIIFSSLDEPLFMHAGSGKISELMQSIGMKENEVLENNMISTSIRRLQKKLEEKITVEQTARSQQQWMNANAAHKNLY